MGAHSGRALYGMDVVIWLLMLVGDSLVHGEVSCTGARVEVGS